MPSNRALFALEDKVRSEFEIAKDDDTQDTLLESIIEAVTAQIESYCGQTFGKTVTYTTEKHDGDGGIILFVDHPPIVSLSDLTVTSGDVDTTITSDYYKLYLAAGKIALTDGYVYPTGSQSVSVTYIGGISGVPPAVLLAAKIMVKQYWMDWSQETDGKTQITTDAKSTAFDFVGRRQMNFKAQLLLAPHRKLVIG